MVSHLIDIVKLNFYGIIIETIIKVDLSKWKKKSMIIDWEKMKVEYSAWYVVCKWIEYKYYFMKLFDVFLNNTKIIFYPI